MIAPMVKCITPDSNPVIEGSNPSGGTKFFDNTNNVHGTVVLAWFSEYFLTGDDEYIKYDEEHLEIDIPGWWCAGPWGTYTPELEKEESTSKKLFTILSILKKFTNGVYVAHTIEGFLYFLPEEVKIISIPVR